MKLSYSQLSATLAAIVIACLPARAVTQQRTVTQGAWQEVFRVDEEHGLLLYKPSQLTLGTKSVILYDSGDQSIKAFSLDGKLLWKKGRKGGGPGEFANPTDIAVNTSGEIHVLDPSNARITVFSRNGDLIRTIPTTRRLHRLVVRPDGSLIASSLSDSLLVRFTGAGVPAGALPLPADMATLPVIVRENRLFLTGTGDILVFHEWATRVLTVDGRKFDITQNGELLHKQEFPPVKSYDLGKGMVATKVDPSALRVLHEVAITGDTAFVIDHREVKLKSYIDAYLTTNMKYISSIPVPDHLRSFVKIGDLLVGIVDEPLPALVAWRWTGPSKK